MSVTEPRPFGVSLDDLRAVRTAVDIPLRPLLRKQFVRTGRRGRAVHADRRCAELSVGELSRPGPAMPVRHAGEFGLAAQFDDVIMDETKHRDELQQMLARWPVG